MTAITMICFTLCVLAFFSLRGQGKEAAAERIPTCPAGRACPFAGQCDDRHCFLE